jgi:hypothetical protein
MKYVLGTNVYLRKISTEGKFILIRKLRGSPPHMLNDDWINDSLN